MAKTIVKRHKRKGKTVKKHTRRIKGKVKKRKIIHTEAKEKQMRKEDRLFRKEFKEELRPIYDGAMETKTVDWVDKANLESLGYFIPKSVKVLGD